MYINIKTKSVQSVHWLIYSNLAVVKIVLRFVTFSLNSSSILTLAWQECLEVCRLCCFFLINSNLAVVKKVLRFVAFSMNSSSISTLAWQECLEVCCLGRFSLLNIC